MFGLIPKEEKFFQLFKEMTTNIIEGAKLLKDMLDNFENPAESQRKIKDLERKGDSITHTVIQKLNKTFVTPLDREDIYSLASAIDTVVDYLDDASELIDIYHIESPMEQAIEQCRILVGSTEHLANALNGLRSLRGVSKELVVLNQLEDEGDAILRDAIGALFEDDKVSPRLIIQWKDIFEALEAAIDSAETAAHLIGNIVVKNG